MINTFFQLFSRLNEKPEKKKVPKQEGQLEPNFINQILLYEEQLHSHRYDMNLVQSLVDKYACIVEMIENQILRSYFLEKIQFVLSRQETMKLLMGSEYPDKVQQLVDADACRMTTRLSESRFPKEEMASPTPLRYSIVKKKVERATQMKIFIELEENKNEYQKDLSDLIKEYESTSKEYDQLIQQQLQDQQGQFAEKLQHRKRSLARPRASSASRERKQDPLMQYQTKSKAVHFAENDDPQPINDTQNVKELLREELEETVMFMRKSIQAVRRSIMKK